MKTAANDLHAIVTKVFAESRFIHGPADDSTISHYAIKDKITKRFIEYFNEFCVPYKEVKKQTYPDGRVEWYIYKIKKKKNGEIFYYPFRIIHPDEYQKYNIPEEETKQKDNMDSLNISSMLGNK